MVVLGRRGREVPFGSLGLLLRDRVEPPWSVDLVCGLVVIVLLVREAMFYDLLRRDALYGGRRR